VADWLDDVLIIHYKHMYVSLRNTSSYFAWVLMAKGYSIAVFYATGEFEVFDSHPTSATFNPGFMGNNKMGHLFSSSSAAETLRHIKALWGNKQMFVDLHTLRYVMHTHCMPSMFWFCIVI
jgi:hypothetical protein